MLQTTMSSRSCYAARTTEVLLVNHYRRETMECEWAWSLTILLVDPVDKVVQGMWKNFFAALYSFIGNNRYMLFNSLRENKNLLKGY